MQGENGESGSVEARTPLEGYDALVRNGTLRSDPAQRAAFAHLDRLAAALNDPPERGFLDRLLGRVLHAPRGVYLWGPVGRGKTLMMDLFHSAIRDIPRRRIHFHAFMDDVHARVHALRQEMKEGVRPAADPIPIVAEALATEARLLCFDEFQVTDIADAMILGRLFDRLFAAGTVVVATSNTPPSGLYADGLNRSLFLPFIARLEACLEVVAVESATDYRRGKLLNARLYLTPLGPDSDARMDRLWDDLTDGAAGAATTLRVKGRAMTVPRAAERVARFRFADLCERPLGPADYLRIAESFDTVLVDGLPLLAGRRNEARRLIWLVDALYDRSVRLAVSAAAEPDQLYVEGDFSDEFKRTASRLVEMRSSEYLQDGGARNAGERKPKAAVSPLPLAGEGP